METSKTVETAVASALSIPLPAIELPEVVQEQSPEAEAMARTLEALATVTDELRAVWQTGAKVAEHCAKALHYAARMAGPGNVAQFDDILKAAEKQIIAEAKVAHWKDLGPEARSYLNYKAQFKQWIHDLKATIPEGVEPVAFRVLVSKWYAGRNAKPLTAKGGGATAPKGKKGVTNAPVVQTGETDPDSGAPLALTVGTTSANITVKGKDGKFGPETVTFPTKVQGGIAKLLRIIGAKLHADESSEDSIAEILAVLDDATAMLQIGK